METSQPPTVAIVSAGAMGAGLGRRLTSFGCRVLTILDGRSESTKQRAMEAGMTSALISEIVREAAWVLSILPPGSAEHFAREFLASEKDTLVNAGGHNRLRTSVFVDCNAKNPETARNLSKLFEDSPSVFLDASIVGLPPSGGHDPVLYASADPTNWRALEEFGMLQQFGLKIKLLTGKGATIGDASALKMAYSGIMKGMVGIYETMFLSAYSHSPVIANELLKELHGSQPLDVERIAFYVPNSLTKAYRFVREMEEMKGFVEVNVDARDPEHSQEDKGMVAQTYSGFASIYQQIADSVAGSGHELDDGSLDVDVLRGIAQKANELSNANIRGV